MTSQAVVDESFPSIDDTACPNSVLGKAQLLLGAFECGASYQLRLTELSRRSGVPKASAYRLAQELVQWGLLDRHGDTYQLGMRIFALGQRVPASAVLRSVARPALTDLFTATRATIHLAVLDGSHVLYLEKIAGQSNIQTYSQVGGRFPATCTATGKVLLATSVEGAAEMEKLEDRRLVRLTSRTVASHDELRRQLDTVRVRGFAFELEEMMPRFGSIAVPITGPGGVVYAAVSATDAISRLAVRRLVPELRRTSAIIARAVARATITQPVGSDMSRRGWSDPPAAEARLAAAPGGPRFDPMIHTMRAAG